MKRKNQVKSGYSLPKSRLARQFFLKLFFFSLFISLLTTALNLFFEGKKEVKNLNLEIQKFENTALEPIVEACWVSNISMLELQIQGLAKNPYIRFIRLALEDQPELSAGKPEGGYKVSREVPLDYTFLNQTICLGWLTVHFSLPDYRDPYWVRFLHLFVIQAVTVFWVSAFIFYLFYMLIGRHLYEIARYTENMTIETMGAPLELKTAKSGSGKNDELSMVVSAINFMLEQINHEMGERKRAERSLKVNKDRLRILVDTIPELVWLKDPNGVYTACNKRFERFLGAREKEIIGKTDYDFVEKKQADFFREKDKIAMAAGKPSLNEEEIVYADDGHKEVLETIKTPMYDSDGEMTGVLGVARDITARKLAEKKIIESEQKYRNILLTAIDGFWIVNLEGKLLEVNQAYSEMSGYSEDELLAMNIQELEYSEAPDEVDKHIQFGVKKGFDRFESVHRKKDGRLYDVEINFRYQFKEQFFIVFIKDISERKRIEAHLSKIQKMESIGNLAGGIAHDFNNLLVPILGMSEILLEDLPQESLEYENAKEIFNAAKRAGDLVKQILVFSRQSEHKKTSVQIQKILKEVLTLSRSTIPSNIEIQKSIQPDCGFVMADPTQIHQITMNLITNAAHAVEGQNGIIDIGLKEVILQENDLSNSELKSGPYIRLSVSDNGIGMPQSIMSKIFDPYFTTKEQGKGTGLGLALVYGIIKEHSGEVKVYSEPGKGTTFNVYLPLIGTKIKAIQETRTMGIPTGKESILLVDDELAVAKLEQQMLYRLGYRVTMKTDSCDALNTFTADPEAFDLVISDMTMPKMTGDQLTQKILSIKPDMPIIICTGFSEKINKDHAQRIGVGGFLMKPVMKSELGQMVRDVLDKSRHPDDTEPGEGVSSKFPRPDGPP